MSLDLPCFEYAVGSTIKPLLCNVPSEGFTKDVIRKGTEGTASAPSVRNSSLSLWWLWQKKKILPPRSAENARDREFGSTQCFFVTTKRDFVRCSLVWEKMSDTKNRSGDFTMNHNFKLCATLRGSHDASKDVDTERWHHEVYTPRDRTLETYNSKSYLFLINDKHEYVLRFDGALETYEGWSLETVFGWERFSWVEGDRHMELRVAATDTPFNKYVIPYLYPEKHRDPIWPEEASRFLLKFQNKHPEKALNVLFKWMREEDETSTHFFKAKRILEPLIGTHPLEIEDKLRLQIRKGGKGIQKLVTPLDSTTNYALVDEVKERIKEWKASHGDWYVATLISTST